MHDPCNANEKAESPVTYALVLKHKISGKYGRLFANYAQYHYKKSTLNFDRICEGKILPLKYML